MATAETDGKTLGFNSSSPRSAIHRTNLNPSSIYDYELTSDGYERRTKLSPFMIKTHIPMQDRLVKRAQSPPVGTYSV